MTRLFFLAGLLVITLLLTACPADTGPTPCTGDSCPKPVACEANPAIVKPSVTQGFTVSSTFKSCYKRGASDTVTFDLTIEESKISTERVIFVVDIVVENANKSTTSVASQFIASQNDISVTPNIFVNGASKAELVAGLKANINFKFKSSSPVGDPYYFVISAFKGGGNTNNPADLIGRIIYKFKTAEQ